MNKFRLSLFLICAVSVMFLGGCKKKSPTVIGTWTFTNLTGTSVSANSNPASSETTTYTYDASTKTINSTIADVPGSTSAGNPETAVSLVIAINNDGTYTSTEVYTYNGTTYNKVISGEWEYSSNSTANNTITFTNGASDLSFGEAGNGWTISTLTDSQMQLYYNANNASTTTTGGVANTATTSYTWTVSFSR